MTTRETKHTPHLRTKTFTLPDGAMPYEQLHEFYQATIAERDRLKAENVKLRKALGAFVIATHPSIQPLSDSARMSYDQARAALASTRGES